MRLFVAICLSEEFRRSLLALQNEMKRAGVRGNYTKVENLHLTLAFIGEQDSSDGVFEAMKRVPFAPFDLALEGVGSFGELWWAGLKKSDELEKLAARLRRALGEDGIPFDRKRFSPHITLIRQPDRVQMPPLDLRPASMRVGRVSLMRSERGKNGMIYTEIGYIE